MDLTTPILIMTPTKRKNFILLEKIPHTGIFIILLLLFLFVACGPSPESGLTEMSGKAPDFTLRDIQDQAFRLAAERGKMVLLIFTTTWCPSCRESIPLYRDIHDAYGPKGLVVVNVDIQEPPERVRQFAEVHRLPYRVLLDHEGNVGMAYGVVGVPAVYLINQDGEIISDQTETILHILEKVYTGTEAIS
jgi:peroxiredoxin